MGIVEAIRKNKKVFMAAGCLVLAGIAVYLSRPSAVPAPADLRDAPVSTEAFDQLGNAPPQDADIRKTAEPAHGKAANEGAPKITRSRRAL